MALSELQKIIVGGLRVCGVKPGDITLIMLLLKTDQQQWAMGDYLERVIDNPPESAIILKAARKIAAAD